MPGWCFAHRLLIGRQADTAPADVGDEAAGQIQCVASHEATMQLEARFLLGSHRSANTCSILDLANLAQLGAVRGVGLLHAFAELLAQVCHSALLVNSARH